METKQGRRGAKAAPACREVTRAPFGERQALAFASTQLDTPIAVLGMLGCKDGRPT
jgi:hypothetical protein